MHPSLRALAAVASATIAAPGLAAEPLDALFLLQQSTVAAGEPQPSPAPAAAVPARFGARDSVRLNIEGDWISDWSGMNIGEGRIGISWFFADDVEWAIYGQGSGVSQDGPGAAGGGFDFELRWHFLQAERWSLFAGVGIGMVCFTDPVPVGGTDLNFTPSAGVGATYGLDDATRLYVGVRWYHISNAGTSTNNPGMNGTSLWLGLSFGL